MTKQDVLMLAAPTIAAIVTSWMAVWYCKRLWRSAHPDWRDRLKDYQIIGLAFFFGASFGALYQWLLNDFISTDTGIELNMLKASVFAVVVSALASPWLFGMVLWFVLTEVDFKVWKKPSWPNLYDFLNVPHRREIDYNDGHSDLTRFELSDQTERRKTPPGQIYTKPDRRRSR